MTLKRLLNRFYGFTLIEVLVAVAVVPDGEFRLAISLVVGRRQLEVLDPGDQALVGVDDVDLDPIFAQRPAIVGRDLPAFSKFIGRS